MNVARHVKGLDQWRKQIVEIDAALTDPAPAVHLEPIAAGNHVVAGVRSDTYKLVRAKASRAVAVEMEGAGFLGALRRFPEVKAAVIRGVSDLIEDKTVTDKQGWQQQASANAAAFAMAVLEEAEDTYCSAVSDFRREARQRRDAELLDWMTEHIRFPPQHSAPRWDRQATRALLIELWLEQARPRQVDDIAAEIARRQS